MSDARAGGNSRSKIQKADFKPERRWPRYKAKIPVRASFSLKGESVELRGEASDISAGGMRLFLTRIVEPGSSLQLRFIVPYSSPPIVVRGVIRNRDGFTHGVEFVNPTAHQQQMIERACKTIELLD